MRHFFIEPAAVEKPLAVIKGSEAHHISNVLRLKPGDSIRLFDGTGFEYEAVIVNVADRKVEVAVLRKHPAAVKSGVQVIVAQAFLKEKKMDDLVRQLCELGVAKWIPFFAERSVARPGKSRLAGRTERWKRIAREAVKQCRRIDIPEIRATLSFEEVLDFGKACDLDIVFWENASNPLDRRIGPALARPPKKILLMLGPEGGFTPQEVKTAKRSGFVTAGLGPRILRAETATVAACTLVQYLFGDMGQKNLDKDRAME